VGFPSPTTDTRSTERFFTRHPRLARACASGLTIAALLGASAAPALAYPADPSVSVHADAPAASANPAATNLLPTLPDLPSTVLQAGGLPTTPALPAVGLPNLPVAQPVIIAAPYYSQFDGSIWADSNCGPTSLAMALGALGINADPLSLRRLANLQMGISNPDIGTTWDSLAAAARNYNVSVQGLYSTNKQLHNWTIDDLKAQLSQGHPVLMLVHYPELPGHAASGFRGDHYILALGFDASGNLVFNDPATRGGNNGTVTASPAQILAAWSDTTVGFVRTAMALAK